MRALTLVPFALACSMACAQTAHRPDAARTTASNAPAEPAIAAVLAAFARYEVVAINAGHGMKDIDDFLLALVRDPRFPDEVNDIAVECGNSRYQPVLDRYIAGMEVPFTEVRKVWRNTTQAMCSYSAFYEQLFPLVRAINQRLPPNKRLRVLAGDPPIDWDQVKTSDDATRRYFQRDETIAAVMEKEVLAKHRKALMLFGTFHLMHGQATNAVSTYEKTYPHVTFVISDLGTYDTSRFAAWPNPSLVPTKGTWLGALSPSDIWPPGIRILDCKVQDGLPPELRRPVEEVVDAFLYLGPRDLRLLEPVPADVVLDDEYMAELQRREALTAFPGSPPTSLEQTRAEVVEMARQPILEPPPPPPDANALEAACRARQQPGGPR